MRRRFRNDRMAAPRALASNLSQTWKPGNDGGYAAGTEPPRLRPHSGCRANQRRPDMASRATTKATGPPVCPPAHRGHEAMAGSRISAGANPYVAVALLRGAHPGSLHDLIAQLPQRFSALVVEVGRDGRKGPDRRNIVGLGQADVDQLQFTLDSFQCRLRQFLLLD